MHSEAAFMEQIQANRGIIKKLVGLYACNEEERKDLYQEILYQAWKGFSSFRGDSKFSTWFYRISLNTILTSQRKINRVEYRETVEDSSLTENPEAEKKENAHLLNRAIRALGETERAIITLHLEGYSNPEIADIMGISANNATVKLHRIKNQLINQLQPQLL